MSPAGKLHGGGIGRAIPPRIDAFNRETERGENDQPDERRFRGIRQGGARQDNQRNADKAKGQPEQAPWFRRLYLHQHGQSINAGRHQGQADGNNPGR